MNEILEERLKERLQSDAKQLPEISEESKSLIYKMINRDELKEAKKPLTYRLYLLPAAALIFIAMSMLFRADEPASEPIIIDRELSAKPTEVNVSEQFALFVEKYDPDHLGDISSALIASVDRVAYKNNVEGLRQMAKNTLTSFISDLKLAEDSK